MTLSSGFNREHHEWFKRKLQKQQTGPTDSPPIHCLFLVSDLKCTEFETTIIRRDTVSVTFQEEF